MAASDPTTRREAARTAAQARVSGMTDEQRREMTRKARETLRAADLRAVDQEARLLGQYPLPDDVREFRANVRATVRARKASDAAARNRAIRRGDIDALLAEGAVLRQGLADEAAGR